MLDKLRDDASSSAFLEDDDQLLGEAPPPPVRRPSGRILGMNAPQRFLISIMLMFTVLLLGILALLVLGKIALF